MKINNIHIAAFSGSLRASSFNRQLILTTLAHLSDHSTLEIIDLANIPFYNHDLERFGFPKAVQEFRSTLQKADALVIATPD
jgi:chromate reductase